MKSFPTENALSRDNGGGGNRTRESFPTADLTPAREMVS